MQGQLSVKDALIGVGGAVGGYQDVGVSYLALKLFFFFLGLTENSYFLSHRLLYFFQPNSQGGGGGRVEFGFL